MKRRHRARPRGTIAVVGAILVLGAVLAPSAAPAPATEAPRPPDGPAGAADLMARGGDAFRRGDLAGAVSLWAAAERAYAAAGRDGERADALANVAAAYESLGHHREAQDALSRALKLARPLREPGRTAALLNTLAASYTSTRQVDEADAAVKEGLAHARAAGDVRLQAMLLNTSGNVLTSGRQYAEASNAYQQSAALAAEAADPVVRAQALVNAGRAEVARAEAAPDPAPATRGETDKPADVAAVAAAATAEAERFAGDALAEAGRIGDGQAKVSVLLAAGQVLRRCGSLDHSARARLNRQAFDGFAAADQAAAAGGDWRGQSYALGYMARLYGDDGRPDEALALTRRAMFLAQQAQSPHALYRWQWQAGKLLAARGEADAAVRSYTAAVATLAPVRNDLALGYGNSSDRETFRESVSPLYYDLADLLLRRADAATDPAQRDGLLLRARDTVETLKTAELEDYFQDPCVNVLKARSRTVEQVLADIEPHTAVVYIIPLADRTELLVSTAAGLQRARADVGSAALSAEVRAYRRHLENRNNSSYLDESWQLYEWLIRPIEPLLEAAKVDTLVFVPDGALRTVPMGALQDSRSETFLISRYAVAVTPGLTLIDPRPAPRQEARTLRGGLSQSVGGFPPLRFVPEELATVGDLYAGPELLDKQFTKERLRRELADNAFTVVHIASHAHFGGTARDRDTFLLTSDGKVPLNELRDMLRPTRFRDQPVALLTLSACQTAAGDDRAGLGLAGVAIEGGARSAVATLWSVNDKASTELIAEFYAALRRDPALSKAKAMQQAQLKVMEEPAHSHPCFWAAYVVIGNWL